MHKGLYTVAAVGSPMASDDAIGLHLAESLCPDTPLDWCPHDIRIWGDMDSLSISQELLEINGPTFIIDCADMGLAGGSTRTFEKNAIRIPAGSTSCHGFGLGEALELACTLGYDKPIQIFGIQPFSCHPGTSLTPEMMACFERVLLECRTALKLFEQECRHVFSCSNENH